MYIINRGKIRVNKKYLLISQKSDFSADKLAAFLISILFLLNPFAAAAISVFSAFYYRNYRFLFFIVAFFALFNLTINPRETDYSWYLALFSYADRASWGKYIFSLNDSKEPLYTSINYFLFYLFYGSRVLFSLFSTCFFYILGILGIKKFCTYIHSSYNVFLFSIIFFLFFPFIFANTANLLRQYWATGLILYSIPGVLVGEKKYWFIAIAAVFVHTSSGIIIMLMLLPFLKKPLDWYMGLLYFSLFLFLMNFADIIYAIYPLLPSSFLNYALTKVIAGTTFETEYTVSKFLFSVFIVAIPFIIANYSNKLRNKAIVIHLINIQLFLLFYIASNLEQAELCVRLNIYLWCFLPMTIASVLSIIKIPNSLLHYSSYIFVLFFVIYEMFFTTYTYACRFSFIFQPSFMYFLQEYLDIIPTRSF